MALSISNIGGSVGVGRHCHNNPRDVKKIQQMLNFIKIPKWHLLEDGKIDISNSHDPTILAIREFQKLWDDLPASGIIKPGIWFNRLKSLAKPIELKKPTMKPIHRGGYRIARRGLKIPRTFKLFLKLEGGNKIGFLDITKNPKNNLIPNKETLIKLLEKFYSLDMWTNSDAVSLIKISTVLQRNGKFIDHEIRKIRNIKAPVKPIVCTGIELTPKKIGINDKNEKLPWKWERGNGVIINHYPLTVYSSKLYFFIYTKSEIMVTSKMDQALSCILFVASCLGVNDDALKGKAATTGWELSRAAHANLIFEKERNKQKILNFLSNDRNINNNYLIWSGGHIMLYSKGEFHESAPPQYRRTRLAEAQEKLSFFSTRKPLWVSGPARLRMNG